MSVKVSGEDVQKAIAELSLLEQVVQELQTKLVALEASIAEHERSLALLDEMAKSTEPMQVLMPIGAGGLVEAVITVRDRVRVNIGQGVYIDATLERGRGVIARRKELLEKTRSNMLQNIQNYSQRIELLRRFLAKVEEALQRQASEKK